MTESPIADRREELTADWTDHQDPRPATLATQEVRLALAFTGGVSLAVWMGGVARELSLLVNASGGPVPRGPPPPPPPGAAPR
jgi:hypothetical protein